MGCEGLAKRRGYCDKHYMQVTNHGRLTPEREINNLDGCKVVGCNNKHKARGYCHKHYQQIRKYGEVK